jgi:Family of unknown function (DUF6062)
VPLAGPQAEFDSHSHWFTERSLADSIRLGECLVCSNLIHQERQAIHSFLWEGMMSPEARREFLKGGGFCARHFWIAKRMEDDGWRAGGIGLAILCESLIEHAILELPPEAELSRHEPMSPFRRKRDLRAFGPGSGCIFCRDSREREESLIEVLEYLKNKPTWSERIEQSPLCAHHALLALQVWRGPEDKRQLRATLETQLRQLQADLNDFIRKHDWNHREEPIGRERDAVPRAIQVLTGLLRQFPFQKAGPGGAGNVNRDR